MGTSQNYMVGSGGQHRVDVFVQKVDGFRGVDQASFHSLHQAVSDLLYDFDALLPGCEMLQCLVIQLSRESHGGGQNAHDPGPGVENSGFDGGFHPDKRDGKSAAKVTDGGGGGGVAGHHDHVGPPIN